MTDPTQHGDKLRAALEDARDAALGEDAQPTGNEGATWHNGVGVGIAVMYRHFRAALAASATDEGPQGPNREALWEKFTGGEKLAYGLGYKDAERARPAVPALDEIGRLSIEWLREADRSSSRENETYMRWLAKAREYAALSPKEPTE